MGVVVSSTVLLPHRAPLIAISTTASFYCLHYSPTYYTASACADCSAAPIFLGSLPNCELVSLNQQRSHGLFAALSIPPTSAWRSGSRLQGRVPLYPTLLLARICLYQKGRHERQREKHSIHTLTNFSSHLRRLSLEYTSGPKPRSLLIHNNKHVPLFFDPCLAGVTLSRG